tara:strand:+ start:113 stop:1342 length:1230 start_codon:yes stop_codon:yes gene_type:complete
MATLATSNPTSKDETKKAPLTAEEKKARREARRKARRAARTMPDSIKNNTFLNDAIAKSLPSNYNFEIKKTLWRIEKVKPKTVALQFPEGLLMYSCIISDIIEKFTQVEDVLIMGDVTYGACCVDDYSAVALGCDMLVHYGHSCLVPVNKTNIPVQYVFVDIDIDVSHLIECIKLTIPNVNKKIAIMGTIQFTTAVNATINLLQKDGYIGLQIPQAKPLSRGEVLGCTSPMLASDVEILIFIADGRFHLESAMIQNPHAIAYQYNPYSKIMTVENYQTKEMHTLRYNQIKKAKRSNKHQMWGIILGTLGRQGNTEILDRLCKLLKKNNKDYFLLLLSEIFPAKLNQFNNIDVWVQIACPRLSIDWGEAFNQPLLNTYEANVTLGNVEWKDVYPMDFYRKESGPWTNYFN